MSATKGSEKRLRAKAARGIKKPPYYEDYKISSLVTVTAIGITVFKLKIYE